MLIQKSPSSRNVPGRCTGHRFKPQVHTWLCSLLGSVWWAGWGHRLRPGGKKEESLMSHQFLWLLQIVESSAQVRAAVAGMMGRGKAEALGRVGRISRDGQSKGREQG
ncbi:testis-expressed sequence 15 protein [Platysternon megacephalum]|uniref:Testis-expressed sequence 15 protein n=1 Tax=Platysternon megacephalum TaxID=55544 RepID=A0A4D9EEY4_9SAUR|nr:testis-expressed sequence 15 protein [Platysternon megacephalum]